MTNPAPSPHPAATLSGTAARAARRGEFIAWLGTACPGEMMSAEGHQPFLLQGPERAWLVTEGHVDVFAVSLENGQPTGVREHFLSVEAGGLLMGFDFQTHSLGHCFLAVGSSGTRVFGFDWTALDDSSDVDEWTDDWAAVVDQWLLAVGEACVRNIPHGPKPDLIAVPGEAVELPRRGIVSTRVGVAWLACGSGDLLFLSTEEVFFEQQHSVFPVSPATWLEIYDSGSYPALGTADCVRGGHLVEGLANFHIAVCNNEFINKKLMAVDEYNRLKSKAEYQQAARSDALAEIASVLNPDLDGMVDVRGSAEGDTLLAACQLIGRHMGIDVKPHPDPGPKEAMGYRLEAIAKVSRFRVREIALRDDWWRRDHGPFLAFREEDGEPVAVLPTSPTSYEVVSGATGKREKVTAAVAESLQPLGKCFYRPFPDGRLNGWKLFRFGTRGLQREFVTVALMGVGLGLLGLVTPFFTTQIFDVIIPGADRFQLLQLVLGMSAAALGVLAFEITRSIAVLRVEGRMDYSIQSALWDRLMALPLGFFRHFSAGDLANRAYGIDKIRELISGAGISAALGAMTAFFYLILLFKYSVPLATVGVLLVAFAMLYTAALNLWQLSYQRHLYGIIGRITSTVLQFISGVAKIRVAGAEDHAFKVWSRQFSRQRRISFITGRIDNALQVFTASFPVICSLALFALLVHVQREALAEGLPPPITTGEFIAFNAAFGIFLSSMLQLSMASVSFIQVIPVYERFKPILEAEPEVDEAKSYPGELSGEIEVYHINFRYQQDGPLVLKNVSIHIKPGEFVAFVGPSGSGKSTLLRLLLGFEWAESGKIYYDGQDLASLDIREVRQQIGVVLQTSRLMPTDIFRNIVGNRPLSKEDAWDAATRASLADDIRALPMQMHTVVSEGGGGFSGGQKQRLMIARAIVHKPRMIFLDEATSALDNRSQAMVTESMDRLQATRVVVAHRLSTIINADRIYVLVDGRVAEQGSYQELMELDGHFAELARRQIA